MIKVTEDIKGLIFDCDGTLADTMDLHWQIWDDVLKSFGIECESGYMDQFAGIPANTFVKETNKRFGTDLDPEEVSHYKEELLFKKLSGIKEITEVADIARKYYGKIPMAVASGGNSKNVLETLRVIGLLDHFDAVVTADDDVKAKPSPDIFLEAARRIKVPAEQCQVFEDGEPGLIAARAAGMVATDVRPYLS